MEDKELQIITPKLSQDEVKEIVETNNSNNALMVGETNPELFKKNLQALNEIAEVIKKELIYGVDYGLIPNTGNKPTLLKSGADKIALLYGLRVDYDLMEQVVDEENSVISYHYKAKAYTMNGGIKIAEGEGLCSSYEPAKARSIPKGATVFSIQNTIMKIAKKRALVDCIIHIGNLSKIFTQDLEDISDNNNALAIAQQSQKLQRNDMFKLYSTVYSLLIDGWLTMTKTQKDAAKAIVKEKQLLAPLLSRAGINAENMVYFTIAERDKLLDYLNGEGANEKWEIN